MNVQEIMSIDVKSCHMNDHINRAAQIMWDQDCGAVPVIDDNSHVVGMLTDRDICMAAYTQDRQLSWIPVSSACAHVVHTCKLTDSLQTAEHLMQAAKIRRIPVVDDEGKLRGMVSLGDLAQHVHRPGRKGDGLSYQSVAQTLAAISEAPIQSRPGTASTARDQQQAQPITARA